MDPNLSFGWINEAINMAYQSRLATARQPHDAEDFAVFHRKGCVGNRHNAVESLQDLFLTEALASYFIERGCGALTEDLPDPVTLYNEAHTYPLASRLYVNQPSISGDLLRRFFVELATFNRQFPPAIYPRRQPR